MVTDYHIHTALCRHAEGEPREYVERAIALGMPELGFADHLPFLNGWAPGYGIPGDDWAMTVDELDDYVALVQDLAREYAAGVRFTEPNHAVAGVDPPGPQEVCQAADRILRGAFTGAFAVAPERAAAFCAVVTSGRADVTTGPDAVGQATRLRDLGDDLSACAELWRAGRLT